MSHTDFFTLSTPREGLIPITRVVQAFVDKSGIRDGICVVFTPHTTSAVTINENADPDVRDDLILGLDAAFPDRPEFVHMEGNSHAHLKSSCVGASETVIIEDGKLLLGTWQGLYFCEFDGPRTRKCYVKILEG